MKKLFCLILSFILCLSVCGCNSVNTSDKKKFTESYIDYFDTVATVTGFETSVEEFDMIADDIENMLKEYHKLFDIYNAYSEINNIYTINEKAGISPVVVDEKIIDLIEYSKEVYMLTNKMTDITFGSVLKIWHEKRENGINNPENATLPTIEELTVASKNTGFEKIIIDREKSSVYIAENGISLDVGAVAKGYATEKIAKQLEAKGITGYALNIGGNIRVIGNKPDGSKWTAAVTDPNGEGYLMNINLDKKSFVTSGSYQRFFTVNGERYHHIISPDTLFPSNYFTSVSVLTDNSALADSLSTALFSMSLEEGSRIIEKLEDTEAVWVEPDGDIHYSSGFKDSVYKE